MPHARLRLALAASTLTVACDRDDDIADRCIVVDPEVVLRGAQVNAQSLNGESLNGESLNGESLNGERLNGERLNGERLNGERLNGERLNGQSLNGERLNGGTLHALNGVRLALADGSAVVAMQEGRLVAGEHASVDALADVELLGFSRSGEAFSVRIESVTSVDGTERISIVAGGAPVCDEGLAGMFVLGHWDETGAHAIDGDELTYACMNGVIAKCVDWGYAPWNVGADLHQTCTRLARADYCGDGHSWTMNGTLIDLYDTLGVQDPVHDPELSFEAAWGEDGALCVNATRWDITGEDGETVLPACFATLPRCASLAEATELGAILANESAHEPIDACGT